MLITISVLGNYIAVDESFLLENVDLSGLDPEISIIQWDTDTQTGEKFFGTEAVVDGYLKPEERFTDPTPYKDYIDEVINQYNAKNNPVVFYRTRLPDNPTFNTEDFFVGQLAVFDTYPQPTSPPEGCTDVLPPNAVFTSNPYDSYVIEENKNLQWDGTRWHLLPFPYDSSVSVAKRMSVAYLEEQVTKHINNQLRIYTVYDIIEGGKSLVPADSGSHGYDTMQDYIDALRNKIKDRIALINDSTHTSQLFDIDYEVEDPYA